MNASVERDNDETAIRDTLLAFRRRHLEPAWDSLDTVNAARFAKLRAALTDTGLTTCSLPEADGGLALSPTARHAALATLGAAHPALAVALVSHLAAQALVVEAHGGRWPAALPADAAYALVGSPLDAFPETPFTLAGTPARLDGARRAMPCHADFLVVAANTGDGEGLALCVLPANTDGLAFRDVPSSHGLCLLPFGELTATSVPCDAARVLPWPAGGRAALEADGLVASLVTGMVGELAQRAIDYARQRAQAGRMIIEHDAVQQLLGPIEMSRLPLRALAIQTLSDADAGARPGDGSASAFAVQVARRAGLDAIQAFGGYGYMQDFRVERYLRDANTLETFWIHAAAREREAAVRRSDALMRGEEG